MDFPIVVLKSFVAGLETCFSILIDPFGHLLVGAPTGIGSGFLCYPGHWAPAASKPKRMFDGFGSYDSFLWQFSLQIG